MSVLYAGNLGPESDPEIRSTVSEAPDSTVPAESPKRPEGPGDVHIDTRVTGGLQHHDTASYVYPKQDSAVQTGEPALIAAKLNDARQADVGTAAQRERAGEFGHGTITAIEGIEPAYQDAPFSDVYFSAQTRAVQGGTRTDVTGGRNPSVGSQDAAVLSASAAAARAARGAAYATLNASR